MLQNYVPQAHYTADNKLTLTPEQEALLPEFKERYDRIQLSTARVDIEKLIVPTKDLYEAAGLARPQNVVFAESPVIAAAGGVFAAAGWWLWARYGKSEEQMEDMLQKAGDKAGERVSRWFATETDGFDDAGVVIPSLAPSAEAFKSAFLRVAREALKGCFDQPHDPAGDSDPLEGEWYDVALRSLPHYSSFWHGGNTCAYSFSHLVALSELTGHDFGDVWPKFLLYKFCTEEGGPRMMHKSFCVYSDRPTTHTTVVRDGVYINHNTDGPAVTWADGSGVYFIDGTRVPPWLVETPADKLDPAVFSRFRNNTQRDKFITKIGVERLLDVCKAKTIEKEGDVYELLTLDLGDGRGLPFLKMLNPTTAVHHVEGVPPDVNSIDAAILWRNRIEPSQVDDVNGADYYQQGENVIKPRGAKTFKKRPLILT